MMGIEVSVVSSLKIYLNGVIIFFLPSDCGEFDTSAHQFPSGYVVDHAWF